MNDDDTLKDFELFSEEELRPREKLFIDELFGAAGFNASKAYRAAGFKGTAASMSANGARLIRKDRVARVIRGRMDLERCRRQTMSGDEALYRISRHAQSDIRKLFPPDSPIGRLPDDIAFSIKAVTPTKHGYRIELYDALRAAEMIAKSTGKLREVVKAEFTLEDLVAGLPEMKDTHHE